MSKLFFFLTFSGIMKDNFNFFNLDQECVNDNFNFFFNLDQECVKGGLLSFQGKSGTIDPSFPGYSTHTKIKYLK